MKVSKKALYAIISDKDIIINKTSINNVVDFRYRDGRLFAMNIGGDYYIIDLFPKSFYCYEGSVNNYFNTLEKAIKYNKHLFSIGKEDLLYKNTKGYFTNKIEIKDNKEVIINKIYYKFELN